jgi:hypothetical protein
MVFPVMTEQDMLLTRTTEGLHGGIKKVLTTMLEQDSALAVVVAA